MHDLHKPKDQLVRELTRLHLVLAESDTTNAQYNLLEEAWIVQHKELVHARQAAEAARQRYQALFAFAPESYLVTDPQGVILEANPQTARLLNICQDLLVGKPLVVFVDEAKRQSFHARLTRVHAGGGEDTWEMHLMPRGRQRMPVVMRVGAARDEEGRLVSLCWLIRDLTERQQVEEAFHRRKPEQGRGHQQWTERIGPADLVGEDPAFLEVKRKIPMVARREAPVLLTGETGTGKELCARALHWSSRRAGQPFVPVNCGAIPVELFERELFGHAKGAFTGAWAAQPGLIEAAEGGTLFLDEVETLSLGAQVKLLRFLQDQSYHALGSPRLRQADVWIIAATNVELTRKVREGTFREDLFYRLAVITLTLPPLRERPTDIPRLAAHLLARYTDKPGGRPRQLSSRALEALGHYAWPGNIRELKNVIQQGVVLTDAQTIESEDLPLPSAPPVHASRSDSAKQPRAQALAQFEQAYLKELLRAHRGNVTQAARAAQMERRAFGRLLKKYHLTTR